jgi:hypothetical protein
VKRRAPNKIPDMASPVSLFGLAACDLADALGCDVATVSVRREGFRTISTAEARAFIAKKPESAAWASVIWLIVAYDVSLVLAATKG